MLKVEGVREARSINAKKLLEIQSENPEIKFKPVFDGDVLPPDQYELYMTGKFNDTPILVGTNSNEGAAFSHGTVNAELFERRVRIGFGPEANLVLGVYPHANNIEASQSAMNVRACAKITSHSAAGAPV